MNGSAQITLNGYLVWAYVVELEGGLRMRFDLNDWERLRLYRGQQISIQREGRSEERLFLAELVEVPPVVWVVMSNRVRATV